MITETNHQYVSGERCPVTGWYEFDGYSDGANGPFPNLAEYEVQIQAGEPFPALLNPRRICFWRAASIPELENPFHFVE